MLEFVTHNWYLFVALGVILFLLAAGPISQQMHGIKSVNVAQTVQLLNRENAVVVDVCEPKEFSTGHVPNAINLPLGTLNDRLREIEKHKNRPIVVSCRSGNRSLQAAFLLHKRGFAKVYSLAGGLSAWQRDNLPVEK